MLLPKLSYLIVEKASPVKQPGQNYFSILVKTSLAIFFITSLDLSYTLVKNAFGYIRPSIPE